MRTIKILLCLCLFILGMTCCKEKKDLKMKTGRTKSDTISNNNFIDLKANLSDFEDSLSSKVVNDGLIDYKNMGISALKNEFLINFKTFNQIIIDNKGNSFDFCKFYLLDNNGSLNLGLALSKNDQLDLKNDLLFILQNDEFIKKDFSSERESFIKSGGLRDEIQKQTPSPKKATEMIVFRYTSVSNYNSMISYIFKIQQLRFKMIKIPKSYTGDIDKIGRFSFTVKPVTKGVNDDEIIDYDAGDLKP